MAVYDGIDKNKYDVVKIVLDSKTDIFEKVTNDIDFAFLALHGKFGEDGQNATSLIFAELYKENSDWNFKAVGQLQQGSLTTLVNQYR